MSATAFQRMRRERIAKMRAEAEAAKTEEKSERSLTDYTNKELTALLDEKGIEYPKKFNKALLIALLEQSGNKAPEDDNKDPDKETITDDEGAE